MPGNVLLLQGEAPYYHRRESLTSVFGLRIRMISESLRHPRSFDSHGHSPFRVSSLDSLIFLVLLILAYMVSVSFLLYLRYYLDTKKTSTKGMSLVAWQRPALARGSPLLPSARELTSVFGLRIRMTGESLRHPRSFDSHGHSPFRVSLP
ncbi:hypothetical protein J2S14_004342 [Lederbergia wuyishanensis]|uniref:Uncharacterized protein n=1 Tax=Lederbergia wuyishanensis TaxID=1347903 RepID=A0ABU0DAP8_9BACI|nr:hypothetical protein [Lederbergia wuyishanensis]